MRVPRIHVPPPLAAGTEVTLPDGAAHHLTGVLRMQPGQALTLFDGRGGEYTAVLLEVGRRRVTARVAAHLPREAEPPQRVVLAQAVSRGDRMDLTLQKATELGVARVVPLVTERSAPLPAGARLEKRVAHWRGVVAAACEQCGRNRLPEIAAPSALAAWLAQAGEGTRLSLVPGGRARLAALPRALDRPVLLAVGPEGGFSAAERALLDRHRFAAIDLGPRILRTETAALVALAQLQCLWWDGG